MRGTGRSDALELYCSIMLDGMMDMLFVLGWTLKQDMIDCLILSLDAR